MGFQSTYIPLVQQFVGASGKFYAGIDLSGFDGSFLLEIRNGAGTATVTINGGFDPALATDQNVYALGLMLLSTTVATGASTSTKTTNTSRSIISNVVSVAANTSALYAIVDAPPYFEAVVSSGSGLGQGTQHNGLSIKLYAETV